MYDWPLFGLRIDVDNGPEFVSRAVDEWAYEHGVALHFIDPGEPAHNASSKA